MGSQPSGVAMTGRKGACRAAMQVLAGASRHLEPGASGAGARHLSGLELQFRPTVKLLASMKQRKKPDL